MKYLSLRFLSIYLSLGYLFLIFSSILYQFLILLIFGLRVDNFFTVIDYLNVSVINIGLLLIILLAHMAVLLKTDQGAVKRLMAYYVAIGIITVASTMLIGQVVWWQYYALIIIFVLANIGFLLIQHYSSKEKVSKNTLAFLLALYLLLISAYSVAYAMSIKNGMSLCDYEVTLEKSRVDNACIITNSNKYFFLYSGGVIIVPSAEILEIRKMNQ